MTGRRLDACRPGIRGAKMCSEPPGCHPLFAAGAVDARKNARPAFFPGFGLKPHAFQPATTRAPDEALPRSDAASVLEEKIIQTKEKKTRPGNPLGKM